MATGGVIGLALGAGFYEGAFIATALVLIAEGLFGIAGEKPVYSVAVHVRSRKKFDHNEFVEHIRSINGILEASITE